MDPILLAILVCALHDLEIDVNNKQDMVHPCQLF
jgi:hypothetical protein